MPHRHVVPVDERHRSGAGEQPAGRCRCALDEALSQPDGAPRALRAMPTAAGMAARLAGGHAVAYGSGAATGGPNMVRNRRASASGPISRWCRASAARRQACAAAGVSAASRSATLAPGSR